MKALRSTLPPKPNWLRATFKSAPVGVDREAKAIRGYVVAEAMVIKDGRGELDSLSLDSIVKLMQLDRGGVKSRFTHPTLSNDGLGTFLGRAKNARRDGNLVRADLFFNPVAFEVDVPQGGKKMAPYIMDLTETDPAALASSLVLMVDEEPKLDKKGNPTGEPPLWRPTEIHASDIVDEGAATNSMLSADGLPDELVRRGSELLDVAFKNLSREVVKERCTAWLNRYLEHRYGALSDEDAELLAEAEKRRLTFGNSVVAS